MPEEKVHCPHKQGDSQDVATRRYGEVEQQWGKAQSPKSYSPDEDRAYDFDESPVQPDDEQKPRKQRRKAQRQL
ncbi:MAG TPA: hypothetical protein VKV74_14385 [Bryobacteraceae bacterium]|nr:hypothetical protein [Bryobacteraceae bacterium]